MRLEYITLGIEKAEEKDQVIDSLVEAKQAGNTMRERRHGIATTYEDLLGGEHINSTEPIRKSNPKVTIACVVQSKAREKSFPSWLQAVYFIAKITSIEVGAK